MSPTGVSPGETLTRRKLGNNLRFRLPSKFRQFDLCTKLDSLAYDGLHDEHLRSFWNSCERQKILLKVRFIRIYACREYY